VAGLGAVGTYLFADVAIGVVYSHAKFGPAVPIIRAFAPVLFLMSVDMWFATVVSATGGAARFAKAKILAVCVTTAFDFVLIRTCQSTFGNGGIGIMLSIAVGEVFMIGAVLRMIPRGTLDGRSLTNLWRTVAACAGTLLIMRPLAYLPPVLAIPVCIIAYGACAAVVGLIVVADLKQLGEALARRPTASARPAVYSECQP
jgi:hypothetical protein